MPIYFLEFAHYRLFLKMRLNESLLAYMVITWLNLQIIMFGENKDKLINLVVEKSTIGADFTIEGLS